MLKSPPTSAALQPRSILSAAQRLQADPAPTPAPAPPPSYLANMATEAAAPRQGGRPLLASQRAKEEASEQTQAQDQGKGPRVMGPYFPLGYKDAIHQWWTSVSPPVAERNLIASIPYLKEAVAQSVAPLQSVPSADNPGATETLTKHDPFGPRVWRSQMVNLSGKNRGLNEFSVERVGEPVDDTLVMLHGYGAGLGFYCKNFEPLTRSPGWKLYALDMLGMGNSTRPPFKIHAKDPDGKITETENWFVDALEEWRKIRKLEKFTLLGHSMGGYLAVSYALKYPGHLNKLILASPVGVPEDPYAVNAAMPEPEDSTLQTEFTQDQAAAITANDRNNLVNAKAKLEDGEPKKRPLPGWLVWLWDANISPFSIVRLAGPLGPRFVSGWTSRRFNHLETDEAQRLHDYAYSLFRQRGSGEYALAYLLAPGAHARRPLINRIQDVGRQVVSAAPDAKANADATTPEVRENGFPIVFLYGENDWMDVAGGLAAEEKLKQTRERLLARATAEERARDRGDCRVIVVQKAGHHLYLDNADEFNDIMKKEMDETRQQTLRDKSQS